jgi:hypothetical protein
LVCCNINVHSCEFVSSEEEQIEEEEKKKRRKKKRKSRCCATNLLDVHYPALERLHLLLPRRVAARLCHVFARPLESVQGLLVVPVFVDLHLRVSGKETENQSSIKYRQDETALVGGNKKNKINVTVKRSSDD